MTREWYGTRTGAKEGDPPATALPSPEFGYWLAGLADGEGCFLVHRQKGGAYYAPAFHIKLRDDDRSTLDLCKSVTGLGTIAAQKGSGNARPLARWSVQNIEDTVALVHVFDRYPLRSKKARDYAIWREAVFFKESLPRGNRWHGPRDWAPMLAYKQRLEDVRRYR